MKFTKMHGLGNDYVYVNCFEEQVSDPVKCARFVSDRHKGIGSDGLILIGPSERADFKMRIFNARINDFVNVFINGNHDPNQRAFNLGYLVHLLTDTWNHKTVRQKMLQIAVQNGVQESDRAFYHMMVNDLEALDHYLLRNNKDISSLFADLTNATVEYSLPGYIEKEYIERSIQWWKEHYLPSIEKRQLMYISEKDIDEFINLAVQGIYSELLQLVDDL